MKITKEYEETDCVDLIEIKTATYIGNFAIRIDFKDGISQCVDFKPFLNSALHPAIQKYSDEAKFQQFAISDGNLNWNDYEMIFPLEELYKGQIKYYN